MAESPARWAISPTDHRIHSLPENDHLPGMLQARCGHLLPSCVVQHDHLPSRELCVACFTAYLLPEPVFSQTLIGRRLSPISGAPTAPGGGQPDPADPAPVPAPFQWARCPVDGQLHLLARVDVEAAAVAHASALCGCVITAEDLTLRRSGTPCVSCLAVATTRARAACDAGGLGE